MIFKQNSCQIRTENGALSTGWPFERCSEQGHTGTWTLPFGAWSKLMPVTFGGPLCDPRSQPRLLGWFSVGHWDPGDTPYCCQSSPSKLA